MINEKEFEDFVFNLALENAVSYNGQANPKALLGRVIPKFPDMKKDMAHYTNLISTIVEQVNGLPLEEQKEKLMKLNPSFYQKKKENKPKEKKTRLPDLRNTENGVVVRFEPAPSGHLHLGHLFPLVANYEIKKKYGGKFILRIADTNPDNIDIKNYDKVIEDVKWICEDNIDEIVYQSDRLDLYYKYLRQLFEMGDAYVCQCESDTFKAYTDSKEMCPHRKLPDDEQKKLFEKFMKGEFKAGEAVLRAKADIENKNPALRSFGLARINENKHARVGSKYKVWPTMQIAVAVDDILMKLTHVIRGKDHEVNMERQKMLHKALGLKSPEYFHMGKMKFEDMNLSKTNITEMIESGKYTGWDDPRVPSVLAYRKRGYKSQAFRDFILSLGISKRDSKITSEEYHKGLDFFNKQILEKEATRFFFVHNPKNIHIENIKEIDFKKIELPKHPEDKSRGVREFDVFSDYIIDSYDFNNLEKGDLFRLMHFGNFKIKEKTEDTLKVDFVSKDYDKDLKVKRNIHFLPKTENDKAVIVLQDNSKLKGFCEDLGNPDRNKAIQFERFGFVRYDSDEKGIHKFYFTHR